MATMEIENQATEEASAIQLKNKFME